MLLSTWRTALIFHPAQLEALGVTRPLHSPPNPGEDAAKSSQADKVPPKLGLAFTSPPLSPENLSGQVASPGSVSDISPLTIRGLSLPVMPLIDLPAPSSLLDSPLKRTKSPIFTSGAGAATTQSRFAELIRRSSRSPSPPKVDDSVRPSSPVRIRRTASMGTLMGVVQTAMRRHGKVSQEPRMELELGQHRMKAQSGNIKRTRGDDASEDQHWRGRS